MQHDFGRRRGNGLRRRTSFVHLAAVCLGLVAIVAPKTAASEDATTESSSGTGSRVAGRSPTARLRTYADMIRRWHAPPAEGPALTPEGRAVLVLELLNTEERIELAPQRDDGGWSEEDLARASHALRDPRSGQEKPVHPRLLDLAYRVQVHFQATALRVVSAVRRGRSKHGKGRAMDIVVPGVRDDEVARFARSLGFVGVGLYPRSGFVHIDTRPHSYYWIDSSGPGQKSRIVQILGTQGEEADARALERGETPPSLTAEGEGAAGGEDAEGSAGAEEPTRKRAR